MTPASTGARPKAPAPTTALDPLAAKLSALGLDHPASCLPELVEQAAREGLSPAAFLDLVLTGELDRKDERRITTMLKLSGLPPGKTLEDFDWSFQPRVDRRQIDALATCAYLREKTNVLFLGPPGVGKSHSPSPLDRMEANLFFRLVSARYERGSMVLTPNKHVRDWPEIFAGDEILTTAILDRQCLSQHHLASLAEAQQIMDAWKDDYKRAAPQQLGRSRPGSLPSPGELHLRPDDDPFPTSHLVRGGVKGPRWRTVMILGSGFGGHLTRTCLARNRHG